MGGRGYKHINSFSPFDSKSVCDRTGFERKLSDMEKTWEGWYVLPEAWAARQPQDFPVVPQKQVVYKEARSELANTGDIAQTFPPIV